MYVFLFTFHSKRCEFGCLEEEEWGGEEGQRVTSHTESHKAAGEASRSSRHGPCQQRLESDGTRGEDDGGRAVVKGPE